MIVNAIGIEDARTRLEKIMLELPCDQLITAHKMYLAGTIDAYSDLGFISEEIREILYAEFTF